MLTATKSDQTTDSPDTTAAPRRARNHRRILCVFPHYAHSFGTFEHAFSMLSVRAFLPPQGILLITAYLPDEWEVRFVDENIALAKDSDFQWADAVFITGMHVQSASIHKINERAHQFGKLTAAGGPSVSGCPDWYPDVDMLHIGEIGDATDKLIARIDADVARPDKQERYVTVERLPMTEFPTPAYEQLNLNDYFLASVQYSSGCPFRCEFCDIPALYGRNPRLKTPQQVTAELDAMLARGNPGCVYFVDDNFIGNPKATVPLLEELVRWQKERGYPVQFACEASLNMTRKPQILELMREAYFTTCFCGIETPEDEALKAMGKVQNMRSPVLDTVKTLNDYGMEVVSGIIVGLDTDTPETYSHIIKFIEASHIPMLTINVIQALPRTQLWARLEREGRLIENPGERESNVDFLLPYETVLNGWRECIERAYTPEAIYRRFAWQMEHTYPNRKTLPATKARVNARNIAHGLKILAQVIWHVGVRSDHRGTFWRMAWPALKQGKIEDVIHVGAVSYHMIRFGKECVEGKAEKSFYSPVGRQVLEAS
ncbi:MAG TPA: B12-binding domain-containing radical SAM protein [Gammaproteobacteria bacterium]|nr:B12-binding domain-containing radical SAM protein [Gammaproteobacteria bacterium]